MSLDGPKFRCRFQDGGPRSASIQRMALLTLEQDIDVFLVKVIPGAGQAVDEDGHDAQDDIQDNPANTDLVLDAPDLRFITFLPELDRVGPAGTQFQLERASARDIHR